MSTIKKLIDQTDFENIQQLSKKWKKDQPNCKMSQNQQAQNLSNEFHSETSIPHPKSKHQAYNNVDPEHQNQYHEKISESNFTSSNINSPFSQSTTVNKKRNVVPQVIDQDTQHFKNRLEHLLSTFKTDAVSQFMGMKRSMLEYQKQCVKSDTQKYLTMYEQKHQQLIQTRQKLIQMTKQAQKKTIQCDQMATFISKLNQRIKITKYLSRPFAILYENKQRQKMNKFKMTEAGKHDNRRLKYKALKGWMNQWKGNKDARKVQSDEKRIEMEVGSIVGKFQKQMEMLKHQLAESRRKNEEFQSNKVMMTENLKKAFLRGMCSMNLEAMSLLGDQNPMERDDFSRKQNQEFLSNTSYADHQTHNYTANKYNGQEQQSAIINQNKSMMNPSSNVIFMSQSKAESKDHKWKQAPILGMQEKREYEEPRQFSNYPDIKTQSVKPTSQGKVIRIVDGKSAVETQAIGKKSTVVQRSVAGSSRKKTNS